MSKMGSVTNIEVIKTQSGTINLAFGFVTICDFLKIRFNVVKGKTSNVFVGWPQQQYEKNGEKKYTDLVSFLNEDDRKEISNEIIKEFNKIMGIVKIVEEKPKEYIKVDTSDSTSSSDDDQSVPFEVDPPVEVKPKKSGLSFRRG